MKNITFKKLAYSLLGVVFISISVSIFRLANIGTDPFSCFNLGVANITGLSFGNAQLLVNVILTVILIVPGWKFFGIGTIFAMVLIGYISDFILYLFPIDLSAYSLFLRVLVLLVGIGITSVGIAMYSCANLGISQYDSIGFLLYEKGIMKLHYARILVDVLLVIGGYLMGSLVGIGTLLVALLAGPTISWLIPNVISPLVNGK